MEMAPSVVEIAVPSSVGSPDPVRIPPPAIRIPSSSPPPYPSVRRGVQRAVRGRGTKHHPYLIDVFPPRPRGLSPSSHLDRRDRLRYTRQVPSGYSGGSSGSDSELGSERSVLHVEGLRTPYPSRSRARRSQGPGQVRPSSPSPAHAGIGWCHGVSGGVGRAESPEA